MTLNSAVSSAGTAVSARDGDDTGGGGRSLPKLSSNGSGGARLNGSSHYPITHRHHHLHHQSSRNHVPPTRRSIFLEEGGGEGVEHELGGEHDFVDLSASPHEDFSSYHPQHFDDHQSMMIMMTHPSPPLSHSLCNDDSSLPPTNNNNNVNTKNNSLSSNLSSAASTPTSAVTVDSISNPKSGAGSPIVTSSKEGDSIRAASSPSTKAPVVVSERDRERRQYPERVGASTHAQQLKQQKKLKQNCLQKLQKEDLQQTVASVANSNGTVNGGGGIADAGNTNSSSSSCLVQTGDHTYRIPDGEKCTVKVGDKIRIIHGPAILNFASSDGLMTSVMGGDVPKLSKFRSSEITSLHLVPNDASATELNISASLGSSPNRSDDDGSGRHSEDQSNFEDCKSRDEMIGYESPSKVDQMGDCYRNSSRKLFHNDTFGEHQANEFEGSWNPHDSSSESMKHNNSFKSSRLQCFENNPKVGNGASVLNSERVGDGELARMLHVDIEMTDLALNNSSSSCEGSNNKSSNSRHVSPCSEKSHDSSYSSSSCGSSKSPDVLSPVNQNRPPAAATAATVNKRTKRKVKLVPYQDTNSGEYVDKVKCALSSVGMPSVTDIETCSAKVAWSGCNRSLFPGGTGDQTSSTNVAHKICYNLSYGKRVAEQNKVTISCGSQTEYTLTCLSPGQCYEVLVWANVDEIQGSASALVTFSSKHSPPERPNAPVLKSASKNSLVVAWQPANVSTNHSSGGGSSKNIIYKLFAAEESQTLDLTATVASKGSGSISGATTGGGGKHGAVSSGGRKNKGGSSSSGGGCGGAGFEYESHLRYEGCQRSAKVDHLNPNTSYKFQLIVSNSEGSSEPSEEVVFTTLSVQPPQPDPPTLVYRDTYNIRLNWKSYLTKHAALLGKLVPEFTLQMEDQKKNQHGFVTQYSGPETCYTVANLPRSSKFKFKLFAEIGCLKSATSEPVVFSTRDCVPHAPTGLNCTDITSNKCTLRWEKPVDDGGSEVTQYIVERSISGGLFQEIYHGVDTCLPISSLFPGMEYHFRVAAENSVGRGMFSTSCPCHTKPVVPAQCSHPNVSGRIKPHSVHIAWLPPDYDGGSRILQYAVKQITDLSKPSDGFEISRDVRRDLIVFQLSPGTVYGFSVCAINSVGRGPWSVPLEVQTAPDKPPAPEPPRVVFSPKSSSSTYARITWCAPSFDNGSPITEYRLEGCEDTTLSLDGADMTSLGGHLVEPFSVAATGCPALGGASMSDHILESHYGSYSSCSSSPPGGVLGGSASMTSSSSSKYMQQQSSYSSLSSAGGGQHSGGANCSSGSSSSGRNSSHHHPHHHHHHLGPQQPLAAGVPASIPGSKRNSFNNYHHNHHHHDSAAAVNSNSSNGGSSATPPASQSDRRSDHHHRSGGNAQHPNGHTPLSMLSRKSHNQVSSSGGSNGVATTSVVPAPPSWFQLYRGVKLSFDYKSIKPATAYKFRVQAVNNIGASAHSKETFIMSPCSAPSAVLNVVPEATVDSVQLSWDVPECNGAPILSYYIDCSCPTNATTTTAGHRNNSTSSTSRSSNHHNSASTNSACGSYETVSARSGGANDNSSDSMFTLQHNQFEQSSSSASSANQKRSSSPNISFQRRTSNDDKTWQLHSFYECDSNSYVINNLRADTLYKIRVRACNENGNGPFSATVKVQTLCLPPEPPLLECVSATASSLRLRWGEASAASGGGGGGGGGSSSKEVTYHLQMEDKSGRFQNTYSGSAVSYRVIRLQEQTSYTFRINASNEAGHGPYSQLYCFSTTKSPPSPPMKAPRVKTVKGDVHSAGFVEASWVAANPCGDDKVLYQLMMATGPSFNEFVVAYKGSGTTCRIENLVKSYCGRSSSQSGSGHNDFRLKVCAIRQCQDDKQEIFGQYSPLCSFQYSASMGHSNSNYGNSGHHSHGASGNSNNNNNYYFSHSNASVLSSSTSAHSHNHVSSFRGHASHSSHSNHNVQSSSCEAMVSTKHNHHLLCDSSANTSEESADSSALCKRGYSLGSSRIGCALKRKFSQWAKKLTDFHPNDTQIAVMVLILFVIVLIAIAVYLQQNFTSF